MFDQLTDKLKCECYILNDLLLKVNNKTFQIDTLIIIYKKILIFEIKNYEGDYFYEVGKDSDRLYKLPKTEYDNPLTQLTRSNSLLRQLLHELNANLPIEVNVVFINQKFTLYQAPLDKPFIFPTQVLSYIEKMDKLSFRLTEDYKRLADKLVSLHIRKSPFTQLPSYSYDQLRKGLNCCRCDSLSITVDGKKCVCLDCGHEELVVDAVLRGVAEIKVLFPGMKITTNLVNDWLGCAISKKRISRILDQYFQIIGVGPHAYYE